MKVKIQVVIENDEGTVEDVQQVACLRRGPLTPEELGMNLAEAKEILQRVQQSMVTSQAADYLSGQKQCPHCSAHRNVKGRHDIVYRTLFGKLKLSSPRLHHECSTRSGVGRKTTFEINIGLDGLNRRDAQNLNVSIWEKRV